MTSRYFPPPASLTPNSIVDTYLRDSGGEKQDRSVDSQLTEVKAFCQHHGLTLRHIYADKARSGKSIVGRERFDQMIAEIDVGLDLPHGLIIWDYARFARNTKDAVYNIALIENKGVVVHSLTDDIPDSEYRDLIRFVKHMGNENERKKNSAAVKREMRQLVREHGAMFGRTPPRGFKREPLPPIRNERTGELRQLHKWVPDPEMVPLVKRAFEMRAAGETVSRIRTATGLYSTPRGFTEFFKNKLYIGVMEFGDIVIPNYCEPIIDSKTWDEVQRLSLRKRIPRENRDHPRRVASSFLLSGLIHCQECGSPMSAYSMNGYDYYVCARRKAKHTCNSRRIPRSPIETEVIRQLEEHMLTLEHLLLVQAEIQNAWALHANDHMESRREIDKRLATVRKKIKNITDAIEEHGSSKSLIKALDNLELQEADLRAEQTRLDEIRTPHEYTRPQLAEIAEQIKQDLHSPDIAQRRAVLRGVVERILAKRTDTTILGVMQCIPLNYKGNATVPPWGHASLTLFELTIPVTPRKAPYYKNK
jgi:site-specific DNA recombinase